MLQAFQRDLLQLYLYDGKRGLYCRKSPAEISHVDLQEKLLLAATRAVRFPPPPAHLCLDWRCCLKPAVVSLSLRKQLALARCLWLKWHTNQQKFPSRCSDFASLFAGFWLEEKPLRVWLMDGESQGNSLSSGTLQSVEQSSTFDPGSALELNLEMLKKTFWYTNLISCISQGIHLCTLNPFWTKALLFSWKYSRQEFFLG